MKIFRRIIYAVILLIIIAGVIVYFSLDHIIKTVVENQATDSLNLPTTLDSARLALFGGELTLNDLQVASPQGYKADHMLGLGKAHVAVKYGQLRKDPIHIESISIDAPMLVIEQENNKLNFKAMMDQQPKKAPPAAPPSGGDRPKDQPIRVVIDSLDITNAQVVIKAGLPGLSKDITVPVPSLSLKNIGNGDGSNNGAAVKEVVMQVVTALANKATTSDALKGMAADFLKNNVGDIAGKLSGQFQQQIGNITSKLPADIKDKIPADVLDKDKIDKTIGGLLGGKKKKKDDQ